MLARDAARNLWVTMATTATIGPTQAVLAIGALHMAEPQPPHWPSLSLHYWQLVAYYLAALLGLSSFFR